MKFSLIIATKGRSEEVHEFLLSLAAQDYRHFEVIIVDQNVDDRLLPVVRRWHDEFPLLHIRSDVANSSHARNLGISAAQGEILAFPDDDCLYPERLLSRVAMQFKAEPALGILTGPARASSGQLSSGRWTLRSCTPDCRSIWTCVIEFNLFLYRPMLSGIIRFDEELGIGARFGSGEGVDLVLALMRKGAVIHYDFDLYVVHPDKSLTPAAVKRAYAYGTGLGRVLQKHFSIMPKFVILNFLIRPVGGAFLSILRGRFDHAQYYLNTFAGRIAGLVSAPSSSAAEKERRSMA